MEAAHQETTIESPCVFEKLQATDPEHEIWWDASPLVFAKWRNDILEKTPLLRRAAKSRQLKRLFDLDSPGSTIIRGVTTNPTLLLQAIQADATFFRARVRDLARLRGSFAPEALAFDLYKDVGRRSAEMMLPTWHSSRGKYGWVSLQVRPEVLGSDDAMLREALELSQLAENVMVKVPGTRVGYAVLEELTRRGISSNNTLTFSVSQLSAYIDAIDQGIVAAQRAGNDLSRFRSVFTFMTSRFSTRGDLVKEARDRGFSLTEAELRFAEVLISRRMQEIRRARGTRAKILICSLRVEQHSSAQGFYCAHMGPIHAEPIVYTLPPAFMADLMAADERHVPSPEEPVRISPVRTFEKLLSLPYFVRCFEERAIHPDNFASEPAFGSSLADVTDATAKIHQFVVASICS